MPKMFSDVAVAGAPPTLTDDDSAARTHLDDDGGLGAQSQSSSCWHAVPRKRSLFIFVICSIALLAAGIVSSDPTQRLCAGGSGESGSGESGSGESSSSVSSIAA